MNIHKTFKNSFLYGTLPVAAFKNSSEILFNFRGIYTEEFIKNSKVENFEKIFYDILIPFESLSSEYLVWKFLMEVPKFNEMP